MLSIQHLFHTTEKLEAAIVKVKREKTCLVQIFTTSCEPDEAVLLAREIQTLLPLAQIIGTSANAVIYRGEQYEQNTLITIEQYENVEVTSGMVTLKDKHYDEISAELCDCWKENTPSLLRLFVGNYYDYAHQLIGKVNKRIPSMKIVGGMSGELYQSQTLPFVFNTNRATEDALIFAGVVGNHLSIYSRINTSHEPISPVYTITKAHGRAIETIEGQPAKEWLQRNIGFLSTKQYDSWEDIAKNDPLVRFQLSIEGHSHASRYLRYDEPTQEITQYFSRLRAGNKFRISYASPAKCVEECKQTCLEVQETPIEQLFCYNCLFRKLYMKNCAKWELTPYHKNPVSGVFLLGEFGYNGQSNELLNGSCVLCGIAEEEKYLSVDLACLDQLEELHNDNEGLLDFIMKKQKQTESQENYDILNDVMTREQDYQAGLYMDTKVNKGNMLKYELDRDKLGFDKICLLKIENAEILMSYLGQVQYYNQLRMMVDYLNEQQARDAQRMQLEVYAINFDAFVIAASKEVDDDAFTDAMRDLEFMCSSIQGKFGNTPFLMRFVLVFQHEFLLEQAYSQLKNNTNTQSRMIVGDSLDKHKTTTREELDCINLIQYAISNNQIIPYYQGIYNNKTKKIDKYEALMRIQDQDGNILPPFHFMDVAKKYRLYLELNLKMFENVMEDFSKIDCAVNINLSAHDVTSPKFRKVLTEKLKGFYKPSNITFEILEDEYFTDLEGLKKFIVEVRKYGAKIAIDDFGSGYSNLLEIAKIRPDYLKIDGQIIRDVHNTYENEAILDVTVSLGEKLKLDLVAEFVENEEIQKVVEKYGVLYSQGYYFSKPQPFSAIYEVEKGAE